MRTWTDWDSLDMASARHRSCRRPSLCFIFLFFSFLFSFFLVGLSPFYLKFCLVNNSEETGDIHVTMIVITNYTRVVVVVVVLLSEQGDAY